MKLQKVLKTVWAMSISPRPVILYHKATARCDCRCRFCKAWFEQRGHEQALPDNAILEFIDRAAGAGMTMYVVWGGEPLLVEGLPLWLGCARARGMRTVVCTSGSLLAERASEIGPVTERLLVSLEAVGEAHDGLRGRRGLFERVCAGLDEYKRYGGEVIIWSNINRLNAGHVEEILRFARERGLWVEFFPTARFGGYNDDIILGPSGRREVFRKIAGLKARGWPVLNTFRSLELMGSSRPFRCNGPRFSVQLLPDGYLYPCDPLLTGELKPYGHCGRLDLRALFSSDRYRESWRELQNCNRCLLPCVADMADDTRAQVLRKAVNRGLYRLRSAARIT